MTPTFSAVSLDVGGVLVVPAHDVLAAALEADCITFERSRFGVGHYLAMAAVDEAASKPEDFTDYLDGFIAAVAVPTEQRSRAHAALAAVLATPVWRQPVAGSRDGVSALVAAGVRLAITSNSDGTIAEHLVAHEWVQLGDGPLASVEVIIDSGVLGVAKPAPEVYAATVASLGLEPDKVLHVGDSVHYDVDGAAACGLRSVHMDPYDVCSSDEHLHIRTLVEVLDQR